MKVTLELVLKTRDVSRLFDRRLPDNRLFIDAILHQFNHVMSQCRQGNSHALTLYQTMKDTMQALTQQFKQDKQQFETMLARKKDFTGKKLTFVAQFDATLVICNDLGLYLSEFIESYDQLIATVKLLHLAGCFAVDGDYYANVTRLQKVANRMLSGLVLVSLRKLMQKHIKF